MWYIDTTEYYLAIKKNETMPFAATCLHPEIITPSQASLTEKDKLTYDISCRCNLKKDANQLTYKTETDLQI